MRRRGAEVTRSVLPTEGVFVTQNEYEINKGEKPNRKRWNVRTVRVERSGSTL